MRTLTVTTAASDRTLLTTAEMRAAAGLASGDGSQDAALQALEARVAACIMSECHIAVGIGANPTLRRETLTEVFYAVQSDQIVLSRRHEVAITSIVVDGTTLDTTDYVTEPESGFVYRLYEDVISGWCFTRATVVYAAGFSTVPDDLKQAAMDAFRAFYLEAGRDPLVKSERVRVDDIDEVERQFWVGAIPGQSSEGPLPATVTGQLQRYRNYKV